jgi:hypothetical protein
VSWLAAIFAALLDWLAKEVKKPDTLTDANTPPDIRRRWADSLRDRLRDKNDGN